jgi:hypothetical protein
MKRIVKLALILTAAAGVLITGGVVLVTNPVAARAPHSLWKVSPQALEDHVTALTAYQYRHCEDLGMLNAASEYIAKQWRGMGLTVDSQGFVADERAYHNLIVRFGGEDKERFLVGAHYDVCGEQPGADDNASAVAGLIEIARGLAARDTSLDYSIELVAFTLEEPPYFRTPFMGSAVHARSLADAGVEIRGMISLEMIGYFSDKHGSQKFPAPLMGLVYPNTGNFIAVVGNLGSWRLTRAIKARMSGACEVPVWSMNAPTAVPGVDFSDHLNYWSLGFDAVMVTDTAFYRNHSYHQPSDTPDTLDYERMAEVVTGVLAAVTSL